MNKNLPRFFITNFITNSLSKVINLPENIFKHAILVLRLKVNQNIILFDNSGYEYLATIVNIKKNSAEVFIENSQKISRESNLEITLIQAIQNGDKMDFTLQKATELGVKNIIPVISERTQLQALINPEKSQKKFLRWSSILHSTCEQCGRNIVPNLQQICYLHKYLNELKNLSNFAENELFLLASPHKNQQTILLKDLAKNKDFQPTKITLLLGPEGGFSDAELAIAEQANFKNFVLGKRILRTETAGLAIISALQTLWGDFLE